MPGKHNAGGCGCCGGAPPCPGVTCSISGTTLSYSVSGATSAYIETWCDGVQTIAPLSPANGSGTQTGIDTNCVYIVVATDGTCTTTKSCQSSACTCAGRDGYVIVDLVETPGSLFTTDNSGTYYAPIGGVNCTWDTGITNGDGTQWVLDRRSVPFVGVRLVFTVLIAGSSQQSVKVFNADYCALDDTYTFGPFFDGSVFVFTIRGV